MKKRRMDFALSFFFAGLLGGLLASCADEARESVSETKNGGWQLVWSDDFNGPTLDRSKWGIKVARPGWINNESQYYTERQENIRVENGNLVLEGRRDYFEGHEYSSGRIHSQFGWVKGRFEARMKLPGGVGTWPAFFMLPNDQTLGWPGMGELDIMEQVGFDPDTILAAHHSGSVHYTPTIHVPGATDGFHVYAAEWSDDRIDIFVDGRKFFTSYNQRTGNDQWPFHKPFHIVLALAVGGHWGGMKGIDPNIWPRSLLVDYVRVYQWN